jgi:tricorn protease
MAISPHSLLAVLLVLAPRFATAQEETGLLRFPAAHDHQVVFTYAGDLFTVAQAGGIARRLTSDAGYEMFARFSPDGKSIAFTAQYDGNTEIYLMPALGGVPERLTTTATLVRDDVSDCMGPNNIVMTWKDSNTIVYRSRQREAGDFTGQLFTVPREGGPSRQLPLPRGGFCSFAPDGKRMAYNRVFREFRTWKRYRGGQADDIWIYDFDTMTTFNITNNTAQDIFPMWAGTSIYFVSDRDGNRRMNLYAYDMRTQQVRTITSFTDFDIKFPSLGNSAIIFEKGGFLYTMALGTEQVQKLRISILEDFDNGRGGLRNVSREITDFAVAPDGSRALFGARGDLFTVPRKNGNTRNLTNTSGVHERNGKWSPDGKWIACISDQTGEDEVTIMPQDGTGQPLQLTAGSDTYKYHLCWSPDSKKLLWADQHQRLQFVDVKTKQITGVARATAWEFSDYAWSPDSRWIAYARPEEERMTTIQLYSVERKTTIEVTGGWITCAAPAFSADGKYLFFISARTLMPSYGQTGWNYLHADMANISLVALAKDTPSPFGPKSDEVKMKDEKKEGNKKEAQKEENGGPEKKKRGDVTVRVDPEGMQQRIAVLPIFASNYRHLQSADGKLFYIRAGRPDEKPTLRLYNFEKAKEIELGGADDFQISADGKRMIVAAEGAYAILDLPGSRIDMKGRLNLNDMNVVPDRHAEWNQIFAESWRQMRDFLSASNMQEAAWLAVRSRYGMLLKYVNHRMDLTYLIGEMIGELNAGHAFVGGGDYAGPDRVLTGLLGAQLERDRATDYFRITRILKGQNWDRPLRSPLTEIGVDVKEGDYILAVDGKPTSRMKDIYRALINTTGKQVILKVNATPDEVGSRSAVVIPIGNEQPLYCYDWVQENISKVEKATGNKVGYVHISDTGAPGLTPFAGYLYPPHAKEGWIVDARGSGGGDVSPRTIERVRRQITLIDDARNGSFDGSPEGLGTGPKVLLLNEYSAPEGEIVAYRFKKYKLGPVVGKRSSGGVVGIRRSLPLLDGGTLNRPGFSRNDVEERGRVVEGHGVDPDIVVDNDPAREFAGIDEQLNKAIELVNEALKKKPVKLPPPFPDK